MPGQLAIRLKALRAQLIKQQLCGFIIGREDMFQGEEVPARDERLKYISGFTGSAGFALVTAEAAVLFSDGRYSLQMQAQIDHTNWKSNTLPTYGLDDWLSDHPIESLDIGIDPWLVTESGYDQFEKSIVKGGGRLCAVDCNPVDAIWKNQPSISPPVPWRMDDAVAGQSVSQKLDLLSKKLRQQGCRAVFLSRVDSVNWLVNMRGGDLPYTPVNLCFAFFDCDNGLTLLGNKGGVSSVDDDIETKSIEELDSLLAPFSGEKLLFEPSSLPRSLSSIIAAHDVKMVEGECPIMLMKARKNQIEIDGFHQAHRYDGVAMVRFLHWFSTIQPKQFTESQISDVLLQFRSEHKAFLAPSFATIAGTGPNAAIVHYRAIEGEDRRLVNGDILLLDSGAHYRTGTTDVTRTLLIGDNPPPKGVADAYTHVLRGHIALATAHFELGATGQQLDGIARAPLWAAGLQFSHGTGHGVGHVLSVHEGPASISRRGSVAIEAGMILSNEPGYYVPNQYGIRLENLIVVRPSTDDKFLCFDTLTLCPFDRRLIRVELISSFERQWLNKYHQTVLEELMPLLQVECKTWLADACAPV